MKKHILGLILALFFSLNLFSQPEELIKEIYINPVPLFLFSGNTFVVGIEFGKPSWRYNMWLGGQQCIEFQRGKTKDVTVTGVLYGQKKFYGKSSQELKGFSLSVNFGLFIAKDDAGLTKVASLLSLRPGYKLVMTKMTIEPYGELGYFNVSYVHGFLVNIGVNIGYRI